MRIHAMIIKHSSTVVLFLVGCLVCGSAFAQDDKTSGKDINFSPVLYPVNFYRKYISGPIGSRCPMYPSCSGYCIDAFKKHGYLMGWIMTCDRLMRCGRDEVKLSDPVWINGKKFTYDPVSDNDFWW